MNIGFDDFFKSCFFIQQLAESMVTIGQIIGVTSERSFFTFILEVRELKFLGQNSAQIISIGLHFVLGAFPLPRTGPAFAIGCMDGLLADHLAFFSITGPPIGFFLRGL